MRRLIPSTLAGQLIAVALIAMIASQAALMAVMVSERQSAQRYWWTSYVFARAASVVDLLDVSPKSLHGQIVKASSSRRLSYSLSATRPVTTPQKQEGEASGQYASELRAMVDRGAGEVAVWVARPPSFPAMVGQWFAEWLDRPVSNDTKLKALVKLRNGTWLTVEMTHRLHVPPASIILAPLLTVLLVFGVTLTLVIRRITRPLKRLALAAEALGRGEEVPPVPVSGPAETRRAIEAFNDMRERLSRFVLDRTRMLAAVGHDLRTPITSLRLRAEFLDDDETRSRILAALEEMEHMAEAALAFARQEATAEATRMVDLDALVQSVCADQADMNRDVTYTGDGRLPVRCRPNSLKRALRNLIDNAVVHGHRARVRLETQPKDLLITVEDDGPGIAEADMPRVFAPFVRLDESRGEGTGGIGLGLAIARSIVRGHGGDIMLKNRDQGGLDVAIQLPRNG